jgi:hypothetical protein
LCSLLPNNKKRSQIFSPQLQLRVPLPLLLYRLDRPNCDMPIVQCYDMPHTPDRSFMANNKKQNERFFKKKIDDSLETNKYLCKHHMSTSYRCHIITLIIRISIRISIRGDQSQNSTTSKRIQISSHQTTHQQNTFVNPSQPHFMCGGCNPSLAIAGAKSMTEFEQDERFNFDVFVDHFENERDTTKISLSKIQKKKNTNQSNQYNPFHST